MSAQIMVTGNLVGPPTTRQTKNGVAVTKFRIGSTERRFDRSSGQWIDGNRFFANVSCWRHLASNVFASPVVGMPVIVTGRISTRVWNDDQEQAHTSYEIEADTVAPDLSWGKSTFERVSRTALPPVALDENNVPVETDFDEPYDVVTEHGESTRPTPARQDSGTVDESEQPRELVSTSS